MALGTRWILLAIGVATLGGCRAIVLDRASVQNVVTTSAPQRFSFDTQLSPKEIAARKLFSAMDRGDTKALLSMADPVEVRLLQLSEKNLKPLVDMYVAEKKKVRSLGITECQAAAREGAQRVKGVSWKELIRRQEERLKDPIYATHYLGRREGL